MALFPKFSKKKDGVNVVMEQKLLQNVNNLILNAETCTGCGICADERCPVKAITITDDVAFVNEAECIGCGLCVTGCPAEAVELVERKQVPSIPATLQDLAVKVLQEKGRLDAFMKIMQS